MPDSPAVEHHPALGKFTALVEGEEAYLLYHPVGEKVLDFASTYTPEDLRGRGIASALVRVALDYAREQQCRVVPSCWFVKGYIQRHPEYLELVAN
jgi:predicted GNAT family acetyltransferase